MGNFALFPMLAPSSGCSCKTQFEHLKQMLEEGEIISTGGWPPNSKGQTASPKRMKLRKSSRGGGAYLIFVTDTRTVSVEKKSVMWRNFKFLYMTDVEKSKILPQVD